MMLAASTGLGTQASSGESVSSTTPISAATKTPVMRVRLPASLISTLREKLAAAGMPPDTAAARLAAANPISSRRASTRCPTRRASDSATARLET